MPPVAVAPQALDAYLRGKGSPLAGLGNAFVQAGAQYGVDPRLLVAASGGETSFGKYGPSQAIHNPFGLGPGIHYPSYQAAITAAAKTMAGYRSRGATTIPQIAAIWAPVGAGNDPSNLNSNWVRTNSQFFRELGGNPSAPVSGIQVAPTGTPAAPPAAGTQTQQQATGGQGLSPALMAGLQDWLAKSSREAAAGKYSGNFMDSPLFKQLLQARTAQMGAPAASGVPSKATGPSPMTAGGTSYQTPFGTTFTAPALPSFVNPLNPTSFITTPKGQKVGIVDFEGKPVNAELASLLNFAKQKGWSGTVSSGYRSVAEQQQIWNATPASRRGTYVARPGGSPHNYAEAVDLTAGPQLEQIIRQYKLPISRYAPEGWHYELSGFRPAAYHPLSFG